jgi:predicted dehydrogenase
MGMKFISAALKSVNSKEMKNEISRLAGSRRSFMKNTALGTAGLVAASATGFSEVPGANARVNVAVIGLKRRGRPLLNSLSEIDNVRVTWVSDVDAVQQEKGIGIAEKALGYRPPAEKDMRKILEKKDVDAVFVATPDHLHAYQTLAALQNGKHVYVEKPCSHNLGEDELLIKAQEKYSKLSIQMGTQQRSSPETREVIKAIHGGAIGKPYKAVAFYANSRGRVPNPKEMAPPSTLDWELWQGPAPRRPFIDIVADYNWHWRWHWGTAESANNGTHEMDVARWALQVEYPEEVHANGGKYHFVDDGWEMYDTMEVTFRYPGNKVIQWEGNSRNGYRTFGSGRGTIIYGTEGTVYVDRNGYRLYSREGELVKESMGEAEAGTALGGGGSMTTRHVRNFIESIRSGEKLHAPIKIGAVSTQMTHYTNVASLVDGDVIHVDAATGHFKDSSLMRRYWGREYEKGWQPVL